MIKLAEFLLSNGYELHVVAAKGVAISDFGYREVLRRIPVHYVPDPYQQYCTEKWKRTQFPAHTPSRKPGPSPLSGLKGYLLRSLNAALVPDPGILYVRRLAREALRVIQDHNIANVLATSPPHSTQVVGTLLKRSLGDQINYILDYRDSWNTLGIFSRNGLITNWLSRYLEARALAAADHITYQSAPVLAKLNRMFFDVSSKATLVMNGFDAALLPSRLPRPQKGNVLSIGYFGMLSDSQNTYRDPTTFFSALSQLDLPIKISLYGYTDLRTDWLSRLGWRLEVCGTVPHAEAVRRMQEMDVLMLLHTQEAGSDEVVPGKLFEYMLAERPALVLGPSNMEAARLVRDEGIGYTASASDQDAIRHVLIRVYEDWDQGRLPLVQAGNLKQYSRQHQYKRLLGLLR
jgi:glycosyltransferase involved in cell wall biosynthesis